MRSRSLGILAGGLVAGLVINACEWAAHRMWLDARWEAAFHALGRAPKGWSAFIPANFWLGILLIWLFTWFSRHYAARRVALVRTIAVAWLVFWVIPMLALAPMELFPNYLLGLVIVVGAVDGSLGVLAGIAV